MLFGMQPAEEAQELAQLVLDLDFITFCRNEDLLVETVAFDIAKELRTLPVEIIVEDFGKYSSWCSCINCQLISFT